MLRLVLRARAVRPRSSAVLCGSRASVQVATRSARALSSQGSGASASAATAAAAAAAEGSGAAAAASAAAADDDSSDDSDSDGDEDAVAERVRTAILDASLRHVARHGWTGDALAEGAQELGYPAVTAGLFPRGPVTLAWHAMRVAHEAMAAELQRSAGALAGAPLNARLAHGVMARLRALAAHRSTWAQAMALGAAPDALPETLRLLGDAADECWWAAGDRSTDACSWYSRRALLVGATAASELYMLTDDSPDLADTAGALARRLDEADALARALGDGGAVLGEAAAGVAAIAASAADLARPILAAVCSGSATPSAASRRSGGRDSAAGPGRESL